VTRDMGIETRLTTIWLAETIFTPSAQFRAHVLQRHLIMSVNVCTKST